ncbi:MAG TPA: sugar ABC transporter ATP-binding protein [Acidisoma sp.]|nr:sugar ABC transporter ATP-binding protein [Acidisoma sp.]
MSGISKSFGQVKALAGVDLTIGEAELIGIVGHNGAGKSTLMGILRGTVRGDAGRFLIDSGEVPKGYGVRDAYRAGIRSVFQELSLCPTLTVVENARLSHRRLKGWGWAKAARRVIADALDAIFPEHEIPLDRAVGELPASARQMVEIARAFSTLSTPPRLVILDEPTSALDARAASQFLAYIGRARESGTSCLLISHRLKEIIDHTERVVVMRDGRVIEARRTAGLSPEHLVEAMGVMAQATEADERRPAERRPAMNARAEVDASSSAGGAILILDQKAGERALVFRAAAGEVVGLAGLDGHGQRTELQAIFRGAQATYGHDDNRIKVVGKAAYVSGDRRSEGIFPLWSISNNLTVSLIRGMARFGLVRPQNEEAAAREWRSRLGIKTPDVNAPILSLSGGNQQKVLIARALATNACIILLDDPMRGVDVSSKREMFELIRQEASRGKCFVLYTTETEELANCDRVYVFYQGMITAEIARHDLSEDRILAASFGRTMEPPHAAV